MLWMLPADGTRGETGLGSGWERQKNRMNAASIVGRQLLKRALAAALCFCRFSARLRPVSSAHSSRPAVTRDALTPPPSQAGGTQRADARSQGGGSSASNRRGRRRRWAVSGSHWPPSLSPRHAPDVQLHRSALSKLEREPAIRRRILQPVPPHPVGVALDSPGFCSAPPSTRPCPQRPSRVPDTAPLKLPARTRGRRALARLCASRDDVRTKRRGRATAWKPSRRPLEVLSNLRARHGPAVFNLPGDGGSLG